jgi:Histidine kinase
MEPTRPGLGLAAGMAAGVPAHSTRVRFLPYLWVLTAFWVYVAVSNLLYANNMQASLTSMKVEHVFAPSGARLLQHLFLYPLFILLMWRSLRTGWVPLWRTLPLQVLFALVFAVLASPALMFAENLTSSWYGVAGHDMSKMPSLKEFFAGPEIPTWVASATNFLVTYCFGLALATGLAFYQRLRDAQLRSSALERALTQAHLATLRMQLSPHTLFNLLHTIRGQITWDPPAAQTMVVQLGDLLRRLLTAGEREFSRLSDELQFVTLYLELQQKRFADRLAVTVPQRTGLPQAWVPSLILQPLVENAVLHGLAGHEAAVTIAVEVQVVGETLTLRVANTIARGKSISPDGIGLANVRERLQVQFGERALFSAGPAGEDLWVAQIVMPLLRDGPDALPVGGASVR